MTLNAARGHALAWGAAALTVLIVTVVWVIATDMRPSYDAFGWLDWGRQVLAWNLNTDGAPSWKPLPFLFTLPYALIGRDPQVWLWMLTSTAAALASSVFAARIAFRLTGPAPTRRWAPWVAGAFAAFGVLGLRGLSELVLIANSDPMVVTICLAAIDAHLCGRRRLTLILLLLAGFGRPEAWAFVGLYALYAWRVEPSARWLAALCVLAIPAAWFIVPALTSHSWLRPGDLALGSKNVIHGSKLTGVLERFADLYELPMQLAVIGAFALAVLRHQRVWLTLAGAALLWVVIEIAFAYHGWSAVPRYLLEPAAVLVVLASAAVGWALAYTPPPGPQAGRLALLAVQITAILALVGTLAPAARTRARTLHGELHESHAAAKAFTRLEAVIRKAGGPAPIKACGQPVTLLGYQSEVAWAVGLSVGDVGWRPGREIGKGIPVVELKPHNGGWIVRPFNTAPRCRTLRIDSDMG